MNANTSYNALQFAITDRYNFLLFTVFATPTQVSKYQLVISLHALKALSCKVLAYMYTAQPSVGNVTFSYTYIYSITSAPDFFRARIQTSNARIQTSNARIQTSNARIQTSNARIQTSNARIQTLNARIQTLNARIQTSNACTETSLSCNYSFLI